MSVVLLEMRQQQQLYNKFQHIGPINCWEFVVYCIGFVRTIVYCYWVFEKFKFKSHVRVKFKSHRFS